VTLTRDTSDTWWRLTRITAPSGHWIDLDYSVDSTNGWVKRLNERLVIHTATDNAGRQVFVHIRCPTAANPSDRRGWRRHEIHVRRGDGTLSTVAMRGAKMIALHGMCPPNPTLTVEYWDEAGPDGITPIGPWERVGTVRKELLGDGAMLGNVVHSPSTTTG